MKARPVLAILLLQLLCTVLVDGAGVFTVPKLRLGICTINKAGSAPIFNLLNAANGNPEGGLRGDESKRIPDGKKLQEYLDDPSWTFVVVLREPTERFASGFNHVCGRSAAKGLCPSERTEDIHALLDAIEAESRSSKINAHFRPASMDCNLETSLSSYTIIPYDEMEQGLLRVLHGLPALSRPGMEAKQARLMELVRKQFVHLHVNRAPEAGLGHIAPIGSSAALAESWRAVAGTAHPDADVWPRVQKFFAADYVMYARHVKPLPWVPVPLASAGRGHSSALYPKAGVGAPRAAGGGGAPQTQQQAQPQPLVGRKPSSAATGTTPGGGATSASASSARSAPTPRWMDFRLLVLGLLLVIGVPQAFFYVQAAAAAAQGKASSPTHDPADTI
jgi:hypothetical protein